MTAPLEALQAKLDAQRVEIALLRAKLEQKQLLTKRELQVLVMVAQGYNNRQIATRLGLSVRTVLSIVSNLLAKLDVANRTQAARYAWRNGLVTVDEAWATVESMQYRTIAKGR